MSLEGELGIKEYSINDSLPSIPSSDNFLRLLWKLQNDGSSTVKHGMDYEITELHSEFCSVFDALDQSEGFINQLRVVAEDLLDRLQKAESWGEEWKEKAIDLIEEHEPEILVLYNLKKD